MASKNRNSSKRKTQRQGLSGNPLRRAEQLRTNRPASQASQRQRDLDNLTDDGLDTLRDLVFRLAGGAEEAPWWTESHDRVVQRACTLDWPSRLSEIEQQTCDLVGGQFYDNLQAHEGGHHRTQWLRALVEHAGAALRKAITDGGDWEPLWTLLYGVALTTPWPADPDEHDIAMREKFPEIKDPYETVVAQLQEAADLLAHSERSVVIPLKIPASGAVAVGVPLVARDAYGSRFLVAAPFGYEADVPDHWYAWDVDSCWVLTVTAAGTFGSSDEALAEWREAVGAVAAGSELSPGDPDLVAKLLAPCLQTGITAELLVGNEPRELLRESYRMRRRARVLAAPANGDAGQEAVEDSDQSGQPPQAHKEFRDWYRSRHPKASKGIASTAESIISEWGPGVPLDEHSFYACSPFRVEMTAHLVLDGFEPGYARRAIRLLPEWTQWCAQKSGIPDDLAAPSIAAARSAVDVLGASDEGQLPSPADTMPFRHQE